MKVLPDDIWAAHRVGWWICITTNIGWRTSGSAVMGAGLARQCWDRYPGVEQLYGQYCRDEGQHAGVVTVEQLIDRYSWADKTLQQSRLIMFPTKPLNVDRPELSWQFDSSLQLIDRSCQQTAELLDRMVIPNCCLPHVGCQNGRLEWSSVQPLVEQHLSRFGDAVALVNPR